MVPNRAAKNDISTADAVQRDHHDDPGDHPGGGQVGDTADAHHLQRVDLLVDPHRAELRGGTGADGRGKRDAGGRRRDEPDVEEGRRESRQRLHADSENWL